MQQIYKRISFWPPSNFRNLSHLPLQSPIQFSQPRAFITHLNSNSITHHHPLPRASTSTNPRNLKIQPPKLPTTIPTKTAGFIINDVFTSKIKYLQIHFTHATIELHTHMCTKHTKCQSYLYLARGR